MNSQRHINVRTKNRFCNKKVKRRQNKELQRSVKTACKSENLEKTTSKHQTSQSQAQKRLQTHKSRLQPIKRTLIQIFCSLSSSTANGRVIRVFSLYVEVLGIMEEKEKGTRGR